MAVEPLLHRRQGRSRAALLTVGTVWAALVAAIWLFEASPWLMGVLAFFTLPAVWELVSNPAAGLKLDDHRIMWFSGRREAEMMLSELSRVRMETRLDFSVRVTLIPKAGPKIRLPYECTPPHQLLEDALAARGIKTERHHFTLAN